LPTRAWPNAALRGEHNALGMRLNAAAERNEASARATARPPLRDHVANSVRRYLRDLDGCDTCELYTIALRELEIPLFAEVLNHCDGNQSRAASMLGIHRATLRKKLREYGMG
jgi:Fis family transcriptional regulator, factor for inversion stimulation protein